MTVIGAIETRAFQILRIMDISKASSLGDVGEVEGEKVLSRMERMPDRMLLSWLKMLNV